MNPSLSDLQHWMLWAITDPRGAAVAIQDPHRADLGPRYSAPRVDLQHLIGETAQVSRGRRLDVYAEAYFARLVETLGDDFASVKNSLGENLFLKFVADYLKVFPSRATNINEAGSHLSEFSRTWLAESPELQNDFAFLPDLCELEWRRMEAFYATETASVDPASFSERTDNEWSNAHFIFANGVTLLGSAWDLLAIEVAPDERVEPSATDLIIVRVGGHVQTDRLHHVEAQILARLFAGASLDEALQLDGESEEAAAELSNWFGKWFGFGLFKEIRFTEGSRHSC